MRNHTRMVGQDPAFIYVMTDTDDTRPFYEWLHIVKNEVIAIDIEATGLNQRALDWQLRTVQFANRDIAWVIPAEFQHAIQFALDMCTNTVAHNRVYDATGLTQAGYEHALMLDTNSDTMIMSHLLDSRSLRDGGIGHGLKALSTHYVDVNAEDSEKALKDWAKANKVKMDDRFREAPLEALEVYAGMDVILTRRLYDILEKELARAEDQLLPSELQIQRVCHEYSTRGFRLDIEYAEALREYFQHRESELRDEITDLGVANPNSTKQIRDVLEADHVELTVKTPSGQASVAKEVLAHIDHPLANVITEFRHTSKYRVSYVERSLELQKFGRVHPQIRSLQARTARMSISDPPLQQLPATDALIRRMFIADDGMYICAADYSQVELRVLAALSEEPAMLEAIANGVDLHTNTAELAGISRKVAKMTNFLTVYGGGKSALSVQAGISLADADMALRGFNKAFPRIKTYGNRLQERSGYGRHPVVTPSGRKLKLDRDRTYTAINYVVQSAARDVLANAMLEIDLTNYRDSMLLPVHDEVIFQRPIDSAQEDARAVADIMEMDFLGVHLAADADVYGPSWGHGYLHEDSNVPASLIEWF